MKIGIMLYSRTGNTGKVASLLKEKLAANGHDVTLEQLEPLHSAPPSVEDVELKSYPSVDAYEALIFAAPVWGGRPATPMLSFLQHLASLQGKKIACLTTGFFPAKWGSNQALENMTSVCRSKGADVAGSGSVTWFSLSRGRQISETVEHLSQLFK
jgi:flavodoxin